MTACLLRTSLVSMSTSKEITFDHSFCIRLLLLGSQGGASLSRCPQIPWIAGTGTPNLDPFFHLFFQPELSTKQQSNIHCICERYTSTIQKGHMWVFLVLGFTLEEKLHGAKCCKFYRPEGVYFYNIRLFHLILFLFQLITRYKIKKIVFTHAGTH